MKGAKKKSDGNKLKWNKVLEAGSYTPQFAASTNETVKPIQEMALSPEQELVIKAVETRRNVLFTGSAGTGKSFTLNHLIKRAKIQYPGMDDVHVTAATGIAATHIGGTTLHSFAGTGIEFDNLSDVVTKVDRNSQTRKRWRECKVLIIDEVSMISGEFFSTLDYVARTIRRDTRPFGGIQLVLTGDFFQLPPVTKNGAKRTYIFETKAWRECIQESIVLKTIFRQKNDVFVNLLQNVRMGTVTDAQHAMLQSRVKISLEHNGIEPTRLYTQRANVDSENTTHLAKLSGQSRVFNATKGTPSGDSSTKIPYEESSALTTLVNNCMAPEELSLKIGAQVMLLKNLHPPFLVNGSRGRVVDFKPLADYIDGTLYPVVSFESGATLTIPTDLWEAKRGKRQLAYYKQLPLCLAWALTVHKCQGMTLDKTELDIGNCWEPGQAYVALSRCTTLEGISLISYNRHKITADKRVIEYYASLGDTVAQEKLLEIEPERTRIEQETLQKKKMKPDTGNAFENWARNMFIKKS